MVSLATEFPIKPDFNKAAFVAQVVAWLRGVDRSQVLSDRADHDLLGDAIHLRAENGEELRIRELLVNERLLAVGFRHDLSDNSGRLWRTEAVIKYGSSPDEPGLLRLRTECIARQQTAKIEAPKKPYLIKTILSDHLGGNDGILPVSGSSLRLGDDPSSIDIAKAIVLGSASKHLPVIYFSAVGQSEWLIPERRADKLAFDLGGIAHVVLEPSRTFSLKVRESTQGGNVYGGTIALALPGRGMVRKFYLGLRFSQIEDMLSAIRDACTSIRSQMPADGWDWTELQEQALRNQRQRDRNKLSTQDAESLYQEEIENLQDRIKQLEDQIASRAPDQSLEVDDGLFSSELKTSLGSEIYAGEFSDRIRLAVRECIGKADQIGLDSRSRFVFDAIVRRIPISLGLRELLDDLVRSTKDQRRVASEVTKLLCQHGYSEKADNKHIRLEALSQYGGLNLLLFQRHQATSVP